MKRVHYTNLRGRRTTLRVSEVHGIEDLTPAPTPAPIPAPTPVPTAQPPIIDRYVQMIDMGKLIAPLNWVAENVEQQKLARYFRAVDFSRFKAGENVTVQWRAYDGSFERVRTASGTYTAVCGGVRVPVTVDGSMLFAIFDSPPSGYHFVRLESTDDHTVPAIIHIEGGSAPSRLPFMESTHAFAQRASANKGAPTALHYGWRPNTPNIARPFTPPAIPTARQTMWERHEIKAATADTPAQFSYRYFGEKLTGYQPVPVEIDDVGTTFSTASNVPTAQFLQPYFDADNAKAGRTGVVEGTLSTCHFSHVTSIRWTERTDVWKLKATTGRTVFTLTKDGLKVLAGERYTKPPYWADAAKPELVGDWSACPEHRRGFKELWGQATDPRTHALNVGVKGDTGEDSHITGVVAYYADKGHGVIFKAVYDPLSHGVPPKISVFATLQGAFNVEVLPSGEVLASGLIGIVQFAPTGDHVRVIPAGASVGMFLVGEWLHYTSVQMRRVYARNVTTNELKELQHWHPNESHRNAQLCVAKAGDPFPEGTVFIAPFHNSVTWGVPIMLAPDDTEGIGSTYGWRRWPEIVASHMTQGNVSQVTYPQAVAIGPRGLAYAGTAHGVQVIHPTDAPMPDMAAINAGRKEWFADAHHLVWGNAAQRLPANRVVDFSANVQSFLKHIGVANAS